MLFRTIVCACAAWCCLAQDVARMDQVVQSYVTGRQFMGTVLVARGSEVVFSKGYGSANLEWEIPNTPNTRFRVGSVTKQFTAASILLLEERGKLSLADPVKKHLPDAPAAWDKVSVLHLLTHTSGIPSFTNLPEYAKLRPYPSTPVALVGRFRDKPLEFEPGEKWNYSNSGYVLLGYLIERVTGTTYENFVRDNIFKPLGMNDSGYDSNSAIVPRRASGYSPGPTGMSHAEFIHMSIPHAAGALYSTTEDLLKWQQGLFGGKLLKPESIEKMTRPVKDNYALGISVETISGRKVIHHGGGIEGFNTQLEYYPDTRLTVAVLGNLNGVAPSMIARKLGAMAHGEAIKLQSERKEITLDPKILSRYVGAYQLKQGFNMLITLEGAQLMSKLGGQGAAPIFPESENLFFSKVVDAQFEFRTDPPSERASQMILHQNGMTIPATRLSDADYKVMVETAASVAKRVKEQVAASGSDTALSKLIEDLRLGKPDYDQMSPGLAAATRQQLSNLQSSVTQLGAVQALKFKGVGQAGADIYEVKFENGSAEWRISLTPDGKIESAMVRPL